MDLRGLARSPNRLVRGQMMRFTVWLVPPILLGLACADKPYRATPKVPESFYAELGTLRLEQHALVAKEHGSVFELPLDQGETAIVDVVCFIGESMDAFVLDDTGLDEFRRRNATGSGRVTTYGLARRVNHYTRRVARPDRRRWYVAVDNSAFPSGGARAQEELRIRVRAYAPSAARTGHIAALGRPSAEE